ncbi:hypothetical protein [Chamaesiphon sp. OTE_75_metabat_556]|jgi:hypothetical protein|uniref:hypothetical protein n=1 Tax=Chamaesiphon sp. OTE_75_metabat_556 TaxID=2964692 RepID=UPI00286D2CD0|nr:hypothetical protein [Chamaesiphon sp. OTE_75_metabat_556]
MHSLEPEEEDFLICPSFEWDDLYPEETFGDRLRLFYSQFNSSTRALLDDALFREVESQSIVTSLEILCANQIIHKRLIQKHLKIRNEIRWIWPETVKQFEIGVRDPDWCGQVFKLP